MLLQERGLICVITMLKFGVFTFALCGFRFFHTLSGLVLDRYTQSYWLSCC